MIVTFFGSQFSIQNDSPRSPTVKKMSPSNEHSTCLAAATSAFSTALENSWPPPPPPRFWGPEGMPRTVWKSTEKISHFFTEDSQKNLLRWTSTQGSLTWPLSRHFAGLESAEKLIFKLEFNFFPRFFSILEIFALSWYWNLLVRKSRNARCRKQVKVVILL